MKLLSGGASRVLLVVAHVYREEEPISGHDFYRKVAKGCHWLRTFRLTEYLEELASKGYLVINHLDHDLRSKINITLTEEYLRVLKKG